MEIKEEINKINTKRFLQRALYVQDGKAVILQK